MIYTETDSIKKRTIIHHYNDITVILHGFFKHKENAENKIISMLVESVPQRTIWHHEPKEGETGVPACGFCGRTVEFWDSFCPACGRALDFGRTSSDAYDID